MLATDNPIPTYLVYDESGASVGRVELPKAERISGRGAATIYLRRPVQRFIPLAGPTGRAVSVAQ